MLLEFRVKNYKSFCDEMVFSMIPAQKQKGLGYSILSKKGGTKTYKGLCSSVVYGPNASGKTNIISAMDTFKQIVLRGHIRNEKSASPNICANSLEYIPNAFSDSFLPLTMSIRFIDEGLVFDYSFTAELGPFLQEDYSRKIIEEKFSLNDKLVFIRNDELNISNNLSIIENYLTDSLRNNNNNSRTDSLRKRLAFAQSLSEGNLNDQELFLMNGFKNIFSSNLVEVISDWLNYSFEVICRADSHRFVKYNDNKEKRYVYAPLNDAAKCAFGLPNTFGYISNDDETKLPTFVSVLKNINKALTADSFESYGTLRFATAVYPLVETALLNGGTLVVDEFDASIHPMILMNIIKIFHNDEINTKGAQLIFNTHNPIFLNSSLFRRDEIKFVERNEETNCSEVYALSDFGTAGEYGVRKGDDYMKNYFVNRYGAIKDVDLSEHFLNVMKQSQNQDEVK